jgi:WhiB family transcriptional regulator, redox-sensing transcriptional regulator
MPDRSWIDQAACAGLDTRVFFPEPSANGRPLTADVETAAAQAKNVCKRCPVSAQCLADAIRNHDQGIRGGLTYYQRHKRSELAPGKRELSTLREPSGNYHAKWQREHRAQQKAELDAIRALRRQEAS